MVGLAVSIAIAFVYHGPADKMARDFDAVGLGTIAPAGSEGYLIDSHANMTERPLAEIDGRMGLGDGGTVGASDTAGILDLGYAVLARSSDPDRVLIATGWFEDHEIARVRAAAARDHVRVIFGRPEVARDVLVPQPVLVAKCPAVAAHRHRRHHRPSRLPLYGAFALLGVAGALARAARPRTARG